MSVDLDMVIDAAAAQAPVGKAAGTSRKSPYAGKHRPDALVGPIGTTSFCWAIKHGYLDASDRSK